jgi:PAS domain S-box-containing protein
VTKSVKQQLRESERQYKLLADHINDVIWVIDPKTLSYVYVSPSVEKFRGYTVDEAIEGGLETALTEDSLIIVREELQVLADALAQDEEPHSRLELEMCHKDGGTVWGEVVTRFIEQDGRFLIVGITRDITSRKKWEREREELVENLEASLAEERRLRRENRVLRGMLPICANCKKIRDESGNWHDLEVFIEKHSEASFTHTICPACVPILYPEL